jgi:hypothetical protein
LSSHTYSIIYFPQIRFPFLSSHTPSFVVLSHSLHCRAPTPSLLLSFH